jgi:hypothetical protein
MVRGDSKKTGRYAWALGLAVVALVVAGCGSGSSSSETAVIDLKSPGVGAGGVIKPNVSCGQGSLWVPLEWGDLPEDTKELAIFIGRFKYVNEGGKRKVFVPFADLVSKIKPTERQLVANVLPEGVSWSFFGTLSCPPVRTGQNILLELFALDSVHQRAMKQRLATRLVEEALKHPHPSEGPRSPGKLTSDTAAIGRLIATYGPPQG